MTKSASITKAELRRAIAVAVETGFDTVEFEKDGKIVRLKRSPAPVESEWDQRFGAEKE